MSRLRTILGTLAIVAFLGAAGGLATVFFGLYNTSARNGHWAITNWVLHTTFENAVALRAPSPSNVPEDLEDPALIELGAKHYDNACRMCHATPGTTSTATIEEMLPHPPNIVEAVEPWQPEELHWIVEQGVKMSGMPGWPVGQRDDEVWAVVAFLLAVQRGMDPEGYVEVTTASGGYCASCHGPEGTSRAPRLDILSPAYIEASLEAFRNESRASGIMSHAASLVPASRYDEIAVAMAELEGPDAPPPEGDIERGAALATGGRDGVPTCLSCHGADNQNPEIPSLDGQGEAYLAQQLRLWRGSERGGTERAPLMSQAAQGLTDAEIDALAAYFASREPNAR